MNAAAKYIKDQLGNFRQVVVSAIHKRLWQLIASYQEQLLFIVTVAYKIRLDGLQ